MPNGAKFKVTYETTKNLFGVVYVTAKNITEAETLAVSLVEKSGKHSVFQSHAFPYVGNKNGMHWDNPAEVAAVEMGL